MAGVVEIFGIVDVEGFNRVVDISRFPGVKGAVNTRIGGDIFGPIGGKGVFISSIVGVETDEGVDVLGVDIAKLGDIEGVVISVVEVGTTLEVPSPDGMMSRDEFSPSKGLSDVSDITVRKREDIIILHISIWY